MKVSETVRQRNPHVDFENIKEKKRHKFNAKSKVVDGIRFHSSWEAARWGELRLLERAGEITKLLRQVRYELFLNGIHICDYIADFEYMQAGKMVVEDAKSPATRKLPDYRIKIKLMFAAYGIVVQEKLNRY